MWPICEIATQAMWPLFHSNIIANKSFLKIKIETQLWPLLPFFKIQTGTDIVD